MKIFPFSILILGLLIIACKDSIELPCQELREGLTETDEVAVAGILNNLLKDLPPVPTNDDLQGHRANLDLFVERLDDQCGFQADVECYACVETFPPISHVGINLDSSGVNIRRTLDIRTPDEALMTVTGVHDF
ncbi:MAG: hypothetical protein ABIQ11_07570 [Saprospiraceae bacterium]